MSYDPAGIDEAELVSRFGYDSGYYRPNGTAKTKAFLPDRENEVSVFRIDDLTLEQVWGIGDAARGRPARVSIELRAKVVSDVGLRLMLAEPPVRHAVIDQWPAEHLRMQLQQQLAQASYVRFRDPS